MQRIDASSVLALPGVAEVLAVLGDARIVGGAVRDLILGLPVQDVDVATPLTPEQVTATLRAAGIRAIPTGIAHGTVTAVLAGGTVEITTLRRDVETDGRHAVVAFTEDWVADAARRDFTINAMSMSADGRIYDYFGGDTDLAAGYLRFVGDAAARIAEDYLRILRYFRFQGRYGRQPPDETTAAALRNAAPRIAGLSAERLWSEFAKILAQSDPWPILRLMAALHVLPVLLPEAMALSERMLPPDAVLRLAALLPDPAAAQRVAARFKLSNAERDRLLAFMGGALPAPDADDAVLRRAAAETPIDILLGRSCFRHPPGDAAALFRARLAAMPPPVFPLQGRDGVALGLPPGPALGEALRRVRTWWLERGCIDDAEDCRAELARVVGGPPS